MAGNAMLEIQLLSMIERLEGDPRLVFSDVDLGSVLDRENQIAWKVQVRREQALLDAAHKAAFYDGVDLEGWGQEFRNVLHPFSQFTTTRLNARCGIAAVDDYLENVITWRGSYQTASCSLEMERSKWPGSKKEQGLIKLLASLTETVAAKWNAMTDRQRLLIDLPAKSPPQSPFDFGEPCDPEFYLLGYIRANRAQRWALEVQYRWIRQDVLTL